MTPRPAPRPLLAVLLAVVLLIGVAACGSDDDPEATGSGDSSSDASGDTGGDAYGGTTTGGSSEAAPEGTIIAKNFSLTDLTVGPGEEIVMENQGESTHTATADDGEFDLGRVEPGDTSEPGTAPEEPGTYKFHCEIHSSMTATLTVEG